MERRLKTLNYSPTQIKHTTWQRDNIKLLVVRGRVFVNEQGVSWSDEVDDQDITAHHWLAYEAQDKAQKNPIGTARLLPDGTLGRMAVLKKHRDKGVGSSLLQHIIRYAINELSVNSLHLSAQLHAIPFYNKFGFEPFGQHFMDAGIEHRKMLLDLREFRARYGKKARDIRGDRAKNASVSSESSSSMSEQYIPVTSSDDFTQVAIQFCREAKRDICIISQTLAKEVYHNPQLCRALMLAATQHPQFKINILVRDTEQLATHFHPIVELTEKLSSHVQLKKIHEEYEEPHPELVLVDSQKVLRQLKLMPFCGHGIPHAPREGRQLKDKYQKIWDWSLADAALRRFHI